VTIMDLHIPATDIREIEHVPGAEVIVIKRHSTARVEVRHCTPAQYNALAAKLVIARIYEPSEKDGRIADKENNDGVD